MIARVKPSPALSALALKTHLMRSSGATSATLPPATLLDVCSSSMAATIKDSEDHLVDSVDTLAQCTRGYDLQWQVLYGHRVEIESLDAIKQGATRGQVTKLLLAVNMTLFRQVTSFICFNLDFILISILQTLNPWGCPSGC